MKRRIFWRGRSPYSLCNQALKHSFFSMSVKTFFSACYRWDSVNLQHALMTIRHSCLVDNTITFLSTVFLIDSTRHTVISQHTPQLCVENRNSQNHRYSFQSSTTSATVIPRTLINKIYPYFQSTWTKTSFMNTHTTRWTLNHLNTTWCKRKDHFQDKNSMFWTQQHTNLPMSTDWVSRWSLHYRYLALLYAPRTFWISTTTMSQHFSRNLTCLQAF